MTEATGPLAALGRISLIGVGAVGSALAVALDARGAQIAALSTRHPDRARLVADTLTSRPPITSPERALADADLVILAVPDDSIAELAASLPWRAGQAAIHLSGAHGLEILAPVTARGAFAAAIHPLMTFPATGAIPTGAEQLARLAGCVWALEASTPALAAKLETLIGALGGSVVSLRAEDRVPYHIAAVLASNYVTTLLAAATRLWEPFTGDETMDALPALLPLLRASVENLARVGLPGALSGPIARGDVGTITRHLAWLDANAGEPGVADLRAAYIALARLAIPVAQAKGTLSAEAAEALRGMLG
ncbi:MAG TPA: DUF2520 domain-containing protein [Ktedonobacterales bacterium]|nr:DUF2520 domain-containing protein [Ktedonobacterales bacterium]